MRAWMRRGLLAYLLLPLSWLFRLLIAIRRFAFRRGWMRSTRLPVPVIVVGNIFIGGTGKTPLVIWLVEALRDAGYKPGVISRGYGRHASAPLHVTAMTNPELSGDEPLLIAQRAACPVVVSSKRSDAAQSLLAAHPEVDVIVCDDGLQHYALQRDIEIVVFDGRGAGNGWLLPAGPLREPASRRRDFTIVNSVNPVEGMPAEAIYTSVSVGKAYRLASPVERLELKELAARTNVRIAAAAGIGNPARFFAMLRDAGIACQEIALPDHHDYSDNPFKEIEADYILITEKDAVKCRYQIELQSDPRLWVVPIAVHPEPQLLQHILEKLRGFPTA